MKKLDEKRKNKLKKALSAKFSKVLKEAKIDPRFINKEQLPKMIEKAKRSVAELSNRLQDEMETLRELEALAKDKMGEGREENRGREGDNPQKDMYVEGEEGDEWDYKAPEKKRSWKDVADDNADFDLPDFDPDPHNTGRKKSKKGHPKKNKE